MTGVQPTVLIVDDSEGVCLALSMMLEKSGYRTHAVHNAEEGLRAAQEHRFDGIIVDRTLGSDSGLQLAERLLQVTPESHIILMSGSVDMLEEVRRHPSLKNLPVLLKPFSRQAMIECIRSVLGHAA